MAQYGLLNMKIYNTIRNGGEDGERQAVNNAQDMKTKGAKTTWEEKY